MTVSDLFDNEGELKNWETVSQEFSLNPVHLLKWYGVLKSIPSSWKKTLKGYNTEDNILGKEESQCGIEANGKFNPLNWVNAKSVYKVHVSQKFSPRFQKPKNSYEINLTLMAKIFGHQFIAHPGGLYCRPRIIWYASSE